MGTTLLHKSKTGVMTADILALEKISLNITQLPLSSLLSTLFLLSVHFGNNGIIFLISFFSHHDLHPITSFPRPCSLSPTQCLPHYLSLLPPSPTPPPQVKRDSDEESDSVDIYEQIIDSLQKQLDNQSRVMDQLAETQTSLHISLRLAEQRTMEAETKLTHTTER